MINAVGAVATGIVLLIVAVTKFAVGAWLPILVVPAIITLFRSIRRHYSYIEKKLAVRPGQFRARSLDHTVVVLVGRIHKGTLLALDYARSLRPNHLVALFVAFDDEDHARISHDWEQFGFDIPLEVVGSPYRELVSPVEAYLDELDVRWASDAITVVIPEFVMGLRSVANALHGQSALALKIALLDRPATVVTSVPFHITSEPEAEEVAAASSSASAVWTCRRCGS